LRRDGRGRTERRCSSVSLCHWYRIYICIIILTFTRACREAAASQSPNATLCCRSISHPIIVSLAITWLALSIRGIPTRPIVSKQESNPAPLRTSCPKQYLSGPCCHTANRATTTPMTPMTPMTAALSMTLLESAPLHFGSVVLTAPADPLIVPRPIDPAAAVGHTSYVLGKV